VLETELRQAESRLAELRREYADGNPERLGSERNYARYQERVSELKAALSRQEADVAALKRELAKLN
jgi:predicted RNase H-like nuclease (RuvC/YqgF family)